MKSTFIWYPGDYEIWLGNKMNNRRTERGAFFPPFWKTDSHYVTGEFSKAVCLEQEETIDIVAEGTYNLKLDGKLQFGMPSTFTVPAGNHKICIKVHNQATPPTLFVEGKTINSDSSWKVTYEDKEWIDESGKASDTSATTYMDAGYWNFDSPDKLPSKFQLCREKKEAVCVERKNFGILADFGKETFGFLTLNHIKGDKGKIHIYYGESQEEAMDKDYCETLDKIAIDGWDITDLATKKSYHRVSEDFTLESSKAFRYVYIEVEGDIVIGKPSMEYEYLPETYRGSFRCNDEEVNRIWDIGAYTMHITTRECFIDGIKRDRWVWSGDAIQSYLMNYYLFFDQDTVKRTIWQLRGKDPVSAHINTIMDYTFFWFKSIADYYLYTGDKHFVVQIYPRMQTMMDHVLSRTNENGMVEGLAGDWVFVDWADFPMDKHGALSFEQILFCKSLETMQQCAQLVGNSADEAKYSKLAKELRAKLLPTFWNEEKSALVHNVKSGSLQQGEQVNKFANMFAIILNYLSEEQKEIVLQKVMLNPDVLKITTPYMRFYELEAICSRGMQTEVLPEIKSYWGGMLRQGATTFWEKYIPEETGTQHLAMYGRPYGKSLCHAWGASPIYLLGKYFLGIKPTKPGYEEYIIKPSLGGLQWMEGTVPTPFGSIYVKMTDEEIIVKSDGGKGTLIYNDIIMEIPANEIKSIKYT